MSTSSYLHDLLGSIAERGRALLDRGGRVASVSSSDDTLEGLTRALLSGRGEASGVALAARLIERYQRADKGERLDYFHLLARCFGPDSTRIAEASQAYIADASPTHLRRLLRVVEPPRQELFRRLNLAPGGTAALVRMREDLIRHGGADPELRSVDDDFAHLFGSWFNRGFLVLRPIDWSTPADILERIIRYEAVHTINGWDDLRRRLQPSDRRCFAFFHPSLPGEPLIFVEVALTAAIPASIHEVLAEDREVLPASAATTAVFYSISNCQPGLRGISFGNFLIKQVVEELSRELPSLRTFVTLSPLPGFGRWLERAAADPAAAGLGTLNARLLAPVANPTAASDSTAQSALLLGLAAHYLIQAKDSHGRTPDPVARFHLGNGARLERVNWRGDLSEKGRREAAGLMVNYLYDLRHIEANHEAFANEGVVVAAPAVHRHLQALSGKTAAETPS